MIELHGWVTIRETYEARFDAEDNIDVIIDKINEEIEHLLYFKPQIRAKNGRHYLETICNDLTFVISWIYLYTKDCKYQW